MHRLKVLYTSLERVRVLFPLPPVPKLSQLDLVLTGYRELHPRHFHRNLRVAPDTFDALLSLIEGNAIFHSVSGPPQLPVIYQLAIVLFRLGHFGNASSVESIAQWAGCSAGLIHASTKRVIVAILGLHSLAFHAPTAEEKAKAKAWVGEQSCAAWSDGWAMVDGTLVPLADKPAHYGEAYFDRKSNYSLSVQVQSP